MTVSLNRARRFGVAEWVLVATLAAIGLAVLLTTTNDAFFRWNERFYQQWTSWAIQFGYLGAFLAALVGNLTIVIVFPYTIVVFFLATSGLNPIILGVVTGLGAVLGESSGYLLGRWGSGAFERHRPEQFASLQRILAHRPRLLPWLLFLFALLPLPDDILFVPLGTLRYPFAAVFLPSAVGKIGAGLIIAFGGSVFQGLFEPHASTTVLTQFGTLALLALVMYAIVKLPWSAIVGRMLPIDPPSRG